MDEFTALAQQVAVGAGDVRGCLIVSRDGLVLGEYPIGKEAVAKPAWLRFAALGEPRKGFVEFPDQLWAYVHRGPYAAFAVAEPSVRPGLLMDRLEQALLVAEEARTKREPIRIAEGPAPSSKPRTPLHPVTPEPAEEERSEVTVSASPPTAAERVDAASAPSSREDLPVVVGGSAVDEGTLSEASDADEPVAVGEDEPVAADRAGSSSTAPATPEPASASSVDRASAAASEPADEPATAPADERATEAAAAPEDGHGREPQRLFSREETDETEVDRVLLAKEFSGLLQMDEDLDDAGS